MELLEGETLRERLQRGPLPWRKAVEQAIAIAQALAAAHEKGIVHRDLKPENLFLTRDGRVKVLDFGLAKLVHPEGLTRSGRATLSVALTENSSILGTAGYMAPEQVRGQAADARTDLFALGTVLYEMQHQAALLLGCFDRHEAHARPLHCLADRFGIGRVILLAFDVRLHVGRRNETHGMSKGLQLARPVMRGGARLDANEAGRKLLEERQHIATLQLSADDGIALRVDAMNLKDQLCDVEADCGDCLHDELLRIRGRLIGNRFRGACAPRGRSRPQHQNQKHRSWRWTPPAAYISSKCTRSRF